VSKPLDKVTERCLVKYSTQAHDVLGLTKASLVGIDRQLIIDLLPDYASILPKSFASISLPVQDTRHKARIQLKTPKPFVLVVCTRCSMRFYLHRGTFNRYYHERKQHAAYLEPPMTPFGHAHKQAEEKSQFLVSIPNMTSKLITDVASLLSIEASAV